MRMIGLNNTFICAMDWWDTSGSLDLSINTHIKIIFLHFVPKLTKLQLGMTHNEIFNIHSPGYSLHSSYLISSMLFTDTFEEQW